MQAYLQAYNAQQDSSNEMDEAEDGQQSEEDEVASRQRNLSMKQMQQQHCRSSKQAYLQDLHAQQDY